MEKNDEEQIKLYFSKKCEFSFKKRYNPIFKKILKSNSEIKKGVTEYIDEQSNKNYYYILY